MFMKGFLQVKDLVGLYDYSSFTNIIHTLGIRKPKFYQEVLVMFR